MAKVPQFRIGHIGIHVTDIDRMVDFYTRILGFKVTDRGEFRGGEMAFMTRDPKDHHQVVFMTGRPEGSYNVINQLSFIVEDLESLRTIRDALVAENPEDIDPADHGNAWSVYFHDPEGNRLEVYMETPWYVAQPHRSDLDFSLSDAEMYRATEERIRSDPSFRPIEEWRADTTREMGL